MTATLTPLVSFLLVAALIAACAASPVQAGIGVAVLLIALALQLAAQNALFLSEPKSRAAETFEEDPREG